MPDLPNLVTFSVAAVVLFVVPGPAVLYIVSRSLSGGRKAGLASVAGIHAGTLVHVAAAVAGLSTLLATSAVAFRSVKWAGAVYLIYLGVRAFAARHQPGPTVVAASVKSLRSVFRQGFVVNVLNPKTAVFFLAFVPQFVDLDRPATTQILVLSALFVGLGLLSDGLYATIFGSIGQRLTTRPWWRTASWAVPTTTYIGLGLFAGLGGAGSKQ